MTQKTSKEAFVDACKCARDGAGGAALSHVGCIAAPAIAGLFGGSLTHGFMAAAMYVTSPLIAMGATWGLDRLRKQKTSLTKLFASAVIAVGVSFAINQFVGHDHGAGDHNSHEHHGMHGTDSALPLYDEGAICGPSFKTPSQGGQPNVQP